MKLVPDPGRPALPVLIMRFARAELRTRGRNLARRIGLKTLRDALPDEWQPPDSALAKQAEQTARGLCKDFIMQHSHRTYCFGALLAARNGLKLDREILFVSAMLHDLGVSDTHADDDGSFEWVSAKLAHSFCLEQGAPADRAVLVHNAIALHTSAGIADRLQPEIAMVHFGAGMDLFGMRIDELPAASLSEILEKHPRDGFKERFSPCLLHQAKTKPRSHIAGAMSIGLSNMIKDQLTD